MEGPGEGSAFFSFVTAFRKAVFGYTEEEAKAVNEDVKKAKELEDKPLYHGPVETLKQKVGLNQANSEMFIGLFIFLVLVMMFKR
jgi:hypothetical protein